MDPIAEMFSQIKSGQNAKKLKIKIHYSKIKLAILEIMKLHNQILEYKVIDDDDKKAIEIDLNERKFIDIKRVSRPGRRVYTSWVKIPRPKKPQAIYIISTSKGVLDGEQARKKCLGGELIAEVK